MIPYVAVSYLKFATYSYNLYPTSSDYAARLKMAFAKLGLSL